MTFHEFVKSVAEHIDSRVNGITFINRSSLWHVTADYENVSVGYGIEEEEANLHENSGVGKQVAEIVNSRLFPTE